MLLKIGDAGANDVQPVVHALGDVDLRFFQKAVDGAEQRVIVNSVGNAGKFNVHRVRHRHPVRAAQKRRAGKTEHRGDVAALLPVVDHLPQFNVVGGGVVHLVDQQRQVGYFTQQVAQLVGGAIAFIGIFCYQLPVSLPVEVQPVKDDLLGIDHEYRPVGARETAVDLLCIGIPGPVAALCRLLLIEYLK